MSTFDEIMNGGADAQKKADEKQESSLGYAEMYERLNPPRHLNGDDLAGEQKRMRRSATMRAIGDAVSSLAGLFAATSGGPSTYDGRKTLSERAAKRYDELMKDYGVRRREYVNGYMRAGQMDESRKHHSALEQLRREQMEQTKALREEQMAYRKEMDLARLELQKSRDEANKTKAEKQQKVAEDRAKLARQKELRLAKGANGNGKIRVTERTDQFGNTTTTKTYQKPDGQKKVHGFGGKKKIKGF